MLGPRGYLLSERARGPAALWSRGSGGPGAARRAGAPGAPYQNLFVPLVVVPFLVVGVLVLVFLFFGAIRGEDASLERNLEALVHGGTNERQQAAMNLSVQLVENREARGKGQEPPWPTGPDFLERLQGSWESLADEENQTCAWPSPWRCSSTATRSGGRRSRASSPSTRRATRKRSCAGRPCASSGASAIPSPPRW